MNNKLIFWKNKTMIICKFHIVEKVYNLENVLAYELLKMIQNLKIIHIKGQKFIIIHLFYLFLKLL